MFITITFIVPGSLLTHSARYDKFGFHGVFVLPILLIIIDIVLRFAVIEKQGMTLCLLCARFIC